MDHIAGLIPTGRRLMGPASDLVELEAENGLRHTAIVFHPEYREHPGITDALGVVHSFLESPLVTGLVELVAHDPEQGAFVYPTGPVWSVAELVRTLADLGEPAGTRAGLELMYTAGQILVEGADAGSAAGVYSHGGLTPRRIMVKQDGQVMVIGHALPQVEILAFHSGGAQVPREDSFRYCPPERMEGRAEDVSSDLFGLALIGFELMTGKPVYDGLVNDIRQQAARGVGSRRLFRFREVVDERVRDVLTRMLRPGQDGRYQDGDDFLDALHGLLSQRKVEGPSLIELMDKVAQASQRQGQQLEAGSTVMVDKDALASSRGSTQESAAGRAPEKTWTPGRRRSVRREGASLAALTERSQSRRTAPEPVAPPPVEVSLEESSAPAAASEPVTAGEGSPRWSKVQRAPARRRAPSAPVEAAPPLPPAASHAPPPPVVPDSSGLSDRPVKREVAGAEALLARIRGSSSPAPAAEPLVDVPPDPSALEPLRTDDAATVMMTRDQLQAKVASALDKGEPLTLDAADAVIESPFAPTRSLDGVTSGGLAPLKVKLPGKPVPVDVLLPPSISAAEAIGWMVGSVLPLPVDLAGRLTGWYRLHRDGRLVSPDAPVSSLSGGLSVAFVPSQNISAEIEVVQGASPVRFKSPVGAVVPVSSLVVHLLGWLGLSGSAWQLYQDGKRLADHAILADRKQGESVILVLRQDGE